MGLYRFLVKYEFINKSFACILDEHKSLEKMLGVSDIHSLVIEKCNDYYILVINNGFDLLLYKVCKSKVELLELPDADYKDCVYTWGSFSDDRLSFYFTVKEFYEFKAMPSPTTLVVAFEFIDGEISCVRWVQYAKRYVKSYKK